MKNYLIIAILLVLTGCNQTQMKYGLGGKNACQFVKEQVPGLREDIQSLEVIAEDSLLCDMVMSFGDITLSKQGAAFLKGEISKDELRTTIDSIAKAATDVEYSWQFSNVINDSLKKLPKYKGLWRKVYTVRVTMKSGITKVPRVLMDTDGTTPRMMERDMEKAVGEHTKHILEVQEYLWTY
jgi:hypothetical protein